MTAKKHILDNREGNRVVDYLRLHLGKADQLRIVTAYFSVYGYELLQDELQGIGKTQFLFGDPASVGEVDPGEKEEKFFILNEDGLEAVHQLQQTALARQCHDWVSKPNVEIRSISRSNFLHGKMYLSIANQSLAQHHHGVSAVTGSSNFTKRGLGGSKNANLELNLVTENDSICAELQDWFDQIWRDEKLTQDVKQDVLEALNRLGKNYAPEHIYFKTLYELFREDIEAKRDSNSHMEDVRLKDTLIWQQLYEFQKDGVLSIISKLQQHGGCILADSVGLGKTYTALAVIKYFELLNDRVLVLCPKKLNGNWSLYPAFNNNSNNPFLNDRFGYTLLSHTDLSRYSGRVGDVDLGNFNWGNFDLVVIDESHNFRNESKPVSDGNGALRHSRYSRLLEEVIKASVKTKLLLLSATPVNTSLLDLRNQIYLMTEKREDAFSKSMGIDDIGSLLGRAQKKFSSWERKAKEDGRKDKTILLNELEADFFKLLTGVSIARSRRQIEKFYSDEIDKIGKFPERRKPENHYPPTDIRNDLSYRKLAEQIEGFVLSIYRPSTYVISDKVERRLEQEKQEKHFNQLDRERYLIGMIRVNFLKRLESSAHSLTETLRRTINKITVMLDKITKFEQNLDPDQQVDVEPDEDEDDDDFLINKARKPYHLSELDLRRWKTDLETDRVKLRQALNQVQAITPDRDGKLRLLKEQVQKKAQCPTVDKDGRTNRKVLIFTTFKDTAMYLYDNLQSLTTELGLHMAMVSGDQNRTTFGANQFDTILTNFAPQARQCTTKTNKEIDLLIATDCISEGQNLQDCDQTINYDIHWNPVRIIQRFGRIDRIGSRNRAVQMVNFWPTKDMDAYLRLKGRVEARMALVDATASADDDLLDADTEHQIQIEFNFRDEQLQKLSEEALDLDELPDGIVMSDFTLDYFIAQLLRYLKEHKSLLEATPKGAYAVSNGREADKTGVIFVLRRRSADASATQTSKKVGRDNREKVASPIHPYYLVYIRANGNVCHSCGHAPQILRLFEEVAIGEAKPLQALCDQFDAETKHGKNMSRYSSLLQTAIRDIDSANTKTQIGSLTFNGGREARIPAKLENSSIDFELVTWLILR